MASCRITIKSSVKPQWIDHFPNRTAMDFKAYFVGLPCCALPGVWNITSVGFLGTMPQKMLPWSSHWNGQGFPAIYICRKQRHTHIYIYICHTGWWYTYPSEKYESQLGVLFPIYGKIKNPNHQPAHTHRYIYIYLSLIHIYIYTIIYRESETSDPGHGFRAEYPLVN